MTGVQQARYDNVLAALDDAGAYLREQWADRPRELRESLARLDELRATFRQRFATAHTDDERDRVLRDGERAAHLLGSALGIAGFFHRYGRWMLVGAASALVVHLVADREAA